MYGIPGRHTKHIVVYSDIFCRIYSAMYRPEATFCKPKRVVINPLTAGVAYIQIFIFYQHIKYHFLHMLRMDYM